MTTELECDLNVFVKISSAAPLWCFEPSWNRAYRDNDENVWFLWRKLSFEGVEAVVAVCKKLPYEAVLVSRVAAGSKATELTLLGGLPDDVCCYLRMLQFHDA
jgi:hypothetical protein